MSKQDKLAGKKRWFEYHCYEGEDSSDAEAWHHTHQQVQVLSKLDDAEVIGDCDPIGMYKVRFPDGLEYDVFGDELMTSPKQFYRPDYKSKAKRPHTNKNPLKSKPSSLRGVR